MKRESLFISLLVFSITNAILLSILKVLFFINYISLLPKEIIINKLQEFHGYVFWLINNNDRFFELWLAIFIIINGALIFYFINTRMRSQNIIISLAVMVTVVIFIELILRLNGHHPGIHTKVFYFTPVDSIYILQGATTDSNGILKISRNARETICKNIRKKNHAWDNTTHTEVYSLASESIKLTEGQVDNDLAKKYHQLIKKNTTDLTALENAIIDYVHCPINEDGFRSISFKQYESKKPKILLLGDSFTWGHSTTIKTNSFADILLSKEYVVYNTGISATDVAQYLAVAKKYIPLLKPDIVIVNFFLGNDITCFKREVLPYKPLLFPTNAGVLMACPHGKYFEDAQSAYNFTLKQWSIPEDNIFNCLMSATVMTTMVWKILFKLNIANYGKSEVARYYLEVEHLKYSYPYCNDELKEIKKITEQNGAKYILSSIPEVYSFVHRTKEDFPDLFDTLPYHEMIVGKTNYVLSNGHFNDIGHSKYAKFLDSVIISKQHK